MTRFSALYFMDSEGPFRGLRIGEHIPTTNMAPKTAGIDDRYEGFMVRAKAGLRPNPSDPKTDPDSNFWPVWETGDDESIIANPKLAEVVAYAMKQDWEAGLDLERQAAANRAALTTGKGVLTIIGGEHDGLRVGPFMPAWKHSMTEMMAGMAYEWAHLAGYTALQEAIVEG